MGPSCDPCGPSFDWCNAFSFRAGFYGDYVFNRDMQIRRRRDTDGGTGRRRRSVDHFSLWTNAGYLALNFCDRFDIFATLGTTKIDLDANIRTFSPVLTIATIDAIDFAAAGTRLRIESRYEFSWSVGGRVTLWECGCTALGIEGQYFRTNPRVHEFITADLFTTDPTSSPSRFHTQYSEWQVGLGLSHRINILVPYVAVKWSGSEFRLNNRNQAGAFAILDDAAAITLRNLQNHKSWGFAVGTSIVDCDKAALTVEGRFGDEQALYVNGQVRF